MKQFKLTFILTVLMSMVGLQAFADFNTSKKIQVGDLYYYLDKDKLQAQVAPGWYTRDKEIPREIKYDGRTYRVTSIVNNAFSQMQGLTSVIIPNCVKSIGESAFFGCTGLTSVTKLWGTIGRKAFKGCSRLTSVSFNSANIKSEAFYDCSGLTSVTFEFSVDIESEAFYGCSGLTSVSIPSNSKIKQGAFKNCSSLTSVTLMSTYIFAEKCTSSNNMKSIFGDQVTEYVIGDMVWGEIQDYAFTGCSAMTSIIFGNGIRSIGKAAFSGCYGLTSVTIPQDVRSIGESAFYSCSGLTSITIGNNVTSIGDYAFFNCSGLTSVTVLNTTPVAITKDVFTNRTNATLYVPQGSKEAYLEADYWKEFKEIIEIDVTGIDQIMNNGQNNTTIFTLDGKRISKPQKGINIIDGKKVVVK